MHVVSWCLFPSLKKSNPYRPPGPKSKRWSITAACVLRTCKTARTNPIMTSPPTPPVMEVITCSLFSEPFSHKNGGWTSRVFTYSSYSLRVPWKIQHKTPGQNSWNVARREKTLANCHCQVSLFPSWADQPPPAAAATCFTIFQVRAYRHPKGTTILKMVGDF